MVGLLNVASLSLRDSRTEQMSQKKLLHDKLMKLYFYMFINSTQINIIVQPFSISPLYLIESMVLSEIDVLLYYCH